MNITRYIFGHADGYTDVIIDIDREIWTDEKLIDLYAFWRDPAEITDTDYPAAEAVGTMLATRCLALATKHIGDVVDFFDTDAKHGGQEGWPKMDGSAGFRIISVGKLDFGDLSLTAEIRSTN